MTTEIPMPLKINGAVLRWARESAALDTENAAQRLGVRRHRVEEWENDGKPPTMNQIRNMSDVYERPLAAFFMEHPPVAADEPESIPDFRRTESKAEVMPAALGRAISRVRMQRSALIDIAEVERRPLEGAYAGIALSLTTPVSDAGVELRQRLGIDDIPKRVVAQPDEFLRALVRRTEHLGVTVTQVQRISTQSMRGFSLADGPYPVVALNGADWPRGKTFTLLHELVHVGLRRSGLCDLHQDAASPQVERFCDQVTAAALMPEARIRQLVEAPKDRLLDVDTARALGGEFGASGEAAVLRLVDLNIADWDDYWRLKSDFDNAYQRFRDEQKSSRGDREAPIYYQLKVRDLGRRFIRQVLEAHSDELISSRDLVTLLGVSYDKVPKLRRALGDVAV